MVAVAETDGVFITSVTFYRFGTFKTEREAGLNEAELGNPVWDDVDSERSSSFAAQHKITEDHLAYWYVHTKFEGVEESGKAGEILELSEVILRKLEKLTSNMKDMAFPC